eukprot:5232561-Amphidinium_carterae.2
MTSSCTSVELSEALPTSATLCALVRRRQGEHLSAGPLKFAVKFLKLISHRVRSAAPSVYLTLLDIEQR